MLKITTKMVQCFWMCFGPEGDAICQILEFFGVTEDEVPTLFAVIAPEGGGGMKKFKGPAPPLPPPFPFRGYLAHRPPPPP